MTQQDGFRVVVGLDCTAHDDAVLTTALIEADRRAATLQVVHAVAITMGDLEPMDEQANRQRRADDAGRCAAIQAGLTRKVSRLAIEYGVSVPVEYEVGRGDPATCLLSAARFACLLVAGTRSGGTGSPLMLGSVSQDIAVHAPCAVLLVPPPASRMVLAC